MMENKYLNSEEWNIIEGKKFHIRVLLSPIGPYVLFIQNQKMFTNLIGESLYSGSERRFSWYFKQ